MEMKYLAGTSTLRLDAGLCNGCGRCAEVCPHAVLRVGDGKARIADRDRCMECGACAVNCAAGALTVRAGVGCAAAILGGALRGTEPSCGCSGGPCCGN
jgi:ferredoxin